MLNLPNFFSFLRIPLAFLFLQENIALRAVAILLALITDGLDGYFARKFKQTTRFGTFFDPLTDRFFVAVAIGVLFFEHKLAIWQIGALFARDGAIFLFTIYLFLKGTHKDYALRAIWWGKITTVLQLGVLFGLTIGLWIPEFVFLLFFAFGTMALIELAYSHPQGTVTETN